MVTAPRESAPVIVVIDDDPATRDVMHEILADADYIVELWDGRTDPLVMIAQTQPHLVIQDIRLGTPLTIWELLDHIDSLRPARVPAVILCSADRDFIRTHRGQLEDRSCAILEKPFDIDQLLETVASCLEPSRR
jgi:DNA-binding NtrC family response regulator